MKVKSLTEMTLEELWQLFPIFLVEHQDDWADWYEQEAGCLLALLSESSVSRLSHIGSTAINGIWAKNIVDILLEVPKGSDLQSIKQRLFNAGYQLMSESGSRLSFNKGYEPEGFADKVFHLHLRYQGDNDELYFRDYLREHSDLAKDYESLKKILWKKYEHNRDAYTEAKSDFIKTYTQKAKEEYKRRYEK